MDRLFWITKRNEFRCCIGTAIVTGTPEMHGFLRGIPLHEIKCPVPGDTREINEDITVDGGIEPNGLAPAITLAIDPPNIRARCRSSGEIILHQRLRAWPHWPIGIEQHVAT